MTAALCILIVLLFWYTWASKQSFNERIHDLEREHRNDYRFFSERIRSNHRILSERISNEVIAFNARITSQKDSIDKHKRVSRERDLELKRVLNDLAQLSGYHVCVEKEEGVMVPSIDVLLHTKPENLSKVLKPVTKQKLALHKNEKSSARKK